MTKGPRGRTYRATATSEATSTTATAATATAAASGPLTALVAARTLTATRAVLGLNGLGLASELDRNLTLKNLLAGQLLDGGVGLVGSSEIHKGIADRAVGAGVYRDRGVLAAVMTD